MGSEIELRDKVRERLDVILEREAESSPHCLARINPEAWVGYATMLLQGASPYTIAKKENKNVQSLLRIRDALWPETKDLRDEFRRRMVDNLELTIEAQREASMVFMENLNDPEVRKDIRGRDIKDLGFGAQVMANTISRLEGGPDVVVEHRHKVTPEEYKELLDGIPEAEVVDD